MPIRQEKHWVFMVGISVDVRVEKLEQQEGSDGNTPLSLSRKHVISTVRSVQIRKESCFWYVRGAYNNMDEQTQKIVLQRIAEAQQNPVSFIDRFCYTFDPRKTPSHLAFKTFSYQKELALEVKQAIEQGYDLFIEKPRDMGVTYIVLDVLLWFWLYVPGSNFLLGSRKQDYVDNTRGSLEITNKEESLFGKLDYTLRHLPEFMLPQGFVFDKYSTFMSLQNPVMGNAISGESANPNFSRSGRYKATLMDEFAFWDNDSQAWGSTADTTNCRIVITTPGIRPNTKAERLRFNKDGEKIKVIALNYKQDPRKTPEWEAKERERRSEEDFAREVLCNWQTSVRGRVYEEIRYATLGDFPFVSSWGLFVSWDFGLDGTAIQFWQHNPNNGKKRIIDSFFFSNKPIQYAFPVFGKPIDSMYQYPQEDLEAIDAMKNLPKAVHFGDPDVEKRAYQDANAVSTREILRQNGILIQTKTNSNQFYIRREKTKVMLQKGIEVNKTPRNDQWLLALSNARYPQRPDSSQATTAITLPIHDWTSHHRTATEYFAVNYEPPINYEEFQQQFPEDNLFDQNGNY